MDPERPPVPRLTVLVWPEAIAPEAKPSVVVVVPEPKVLLAPEKIWAAVKVCATPRAANVTVPAGSVALVVAVDVNVRLNAPDVASVELLASVSVPVVVVTVRPLREVAVATPNTGVTSVGDVDSTTEPDPVEVVVPVPPAVTGRVPVVSADVDVAYTAPPDVNDVRFVPP